MHFLLVKQKYRKCPALVCVCVCVRVYFCVHSSDDIRRRRLKIVHFVKLLFTAGHLRFILLKLVYPFS